MSDKQYDLRTQKVDNSSKKGKEKGKGNMPPKAASGKKGVADAPPPPPPQQAAPQPQSDDAVKAIDTPTESQSIMGEMRKLFSEFSNKIDGKLNFVIAELADVKNDISLMRRDVSDLEKAVEDTSARIESVEIDKIPTIETAIIKLRNELEDQLVRQELHNRKQNLLFYGIESTTDEDAYTTASTAISSILNVPVEVAKQMQIVNAHRLPRRGKATTGTPGPDPIIVRFGRMIDRDRILRAYEETERSRAKATPDQPAQTRISVRCDLPAVMKRERGRLSAIAYNLRKTKSQKTKIKIQGTTVVLLTKEANDQRANWTTWSE